ncbi:MAG: hypothetical protein RLZZ126_1674 [Pseudomonadota bacterium]|jgi:tRNA (guanine37-N1)-methyltransferase
MRFDIVTLFPELFAPFLTSGVTRRAYESGQIAVHLHSLRDFAVGNYRRVDDRAFGGGPGMVMMAEPLARSVEHIRAERERAGVAGGAPVLLFSPAGQMLNHSLVAEWAHGEPSLTGAILICGRYEGLDQRFIDQFVTHQISLGDFVLSGGEVPAMAFLDAIARLQPGVLGDAASHAEDSFNPALGGLLDCPHYTRPPEWRGKPVPPELLSGHHAQIEAWRTAQRRKLTAQLRPDLL